MQATHCPYCNSVLPALKEAPIAEKLPCPRCGEAVPAGRWRIDATADAIQSGAPPIVPTSRTLDPMQRQPAPGLRKTALTVLGIMLFMALLGGSYALYTTKLRQSRHPWMPKKLEPIAFRRPLELSGLEYLPKDCQVVAGLHIGEMMDDEKVGKPLLANPRPSLIDWSMKQITRTSGLTLEEIDHVVVGAAFDAHFPQLVMVVKARAKISLERIAEARPIKSSFYQQLPLYEFSLKPAGEALLWCVADDTIVYVVRLDTPKTEHLSALSATPRPLDAVLPAALHETMKERLPKHNFLWAAGQLDQIGAAKDWLPLLLGGKVDFSAVKDMKAFTLGVAPVEGLTLTGHFHVNDAKASEKLKATLEGVKFDGAAAPKVEVTPADAAHQWVTLQMRGEVSAVREMLGRAEDGKK